MSNRRERRESEITSAIRTLLDDSDNQTALIKARWRDNYDMFVYGTQNEDKEDWQTQFSINKLSSSTRTAQGRLVDTLVNTPDWFSIEPRADGNQQAALLAPTFKKIVDYYLDSASFKKHAGTFFLCALINSGNIHIGWKQRLIQNPEYVLEKTQEAVRKEQRRLATKVANPQNAPEADIQGDELEAKLNEALDNFVAQAQGQTIKKPKLDPYIQVGGLDIKDINDQKVYWDPNVTYMEDSIWRAFKFDVQKYELNHMVKQGLLSKSAVDRITGKNDLYARQVNERLRYKNILPSPKSASSTVTLTYYAGPLIVKDKIIEEKYFALIANDGVILKEGPYPFWEPPGHNTSIITAAIRQIPFRATGAGIGDNAVALQRILDSNYQLVCDSFRFGISGINVVNYQNLVDKTQLEEGIYPGMTLQVRGEPEKSFKHIQLTDNIENQSHPIQQRIEQAIDELTGVNELQVGAANPYSRTSAAETNARLQAGTQNVNIVALDLEQNFLIPALQKCFARILQFGLNEVNSNPELQMLLTDEEQQNLAQIDVLGRLKILNQWYNFDVKGFSSSKDRNEQAQRDNELLQIINSGGALSQLINLPEFMKVYFDNMGIKNPEKLLLIQDSPLAKVTTENQVLMSGHAVIVAQTDDHEFHIKNQLPLANSPYATPELKQHIQQHAQMLQELQAAVQSGGAPGQPGQTPQQGAPQPAAPQQDQQQAQPNGVMQ